MNAKTKGLGSSNTSEAFCHKMNNGESANPTSLAANGDAGTQSPSSTDNIPYEKVGDTITPLEVPFDIPENWEWVRLIDVCEYIQCGKSPKYSPIKKYPVVAQKCNQWSRFFIEKICLWNISAIKLFIHMLGK